MWPSLQLFLKIASVVSLSHELQNLADTFAPPKVLALEYVFSAGLYILGEPVGSDCPAVESSL